MHVYTTAMLVHYLSVQYVLPEAAAAGWARPIA